MIFLFENSVLFDFVLVGAVCMDKCVDEVDEKIISELLKNARLSSRKLARKTGVSPSTLLARLKRLEKDGAVLGYAARVDYEKLGFDLLAVIDVTIRDKPLLEVQEKIAALPGVVSVFDVTGEHDSMVFVRCKNRRGLSALVKKILGVPGVAHTNTHLVLNTVKHVV